MEGIKIDDVFRQVLRAVRQETEGKQNPWVSSCLPDDFCFHPSTLPSSTGKQSAARKKEDDREFAKLREAERLATLEKDRLEKANRAHEQEIARLREAEKVAALEKQRFEREKREFQQELERQRQRERERETPPSTTILIKPPKAESKLQQPLNYSSTVTRLVRLIEQSNEGARKEMDRLYDDSKAMIWIKTAADRGDPDAQFALARRYHLGKGVSKDYSAANRLYLKAAEQGCAGAECNLGYLYYYGQGVARDRAKAFEWFHRAADHGDADAKRMLVKEHNK